MTKQDVITRMTNHGAVDIKEATAPFPKDYNGKEMHDIHYKRPLGQNSKTKPATLRLIKEGADDFVYENGMLGWMKDAPTVTPPRDFHLTDTQIKNGLESQNQGWKVLQINKSRDGDLDRVTVKASAGTNVVTKTYIVWKDGANIEYKEEA